MKEFNFKNLEKDIICDDFTIENGEVSELCINEERYNINQIPSLNVQDYKIAILQKNMCDYIVVKNYDEHLEFAFKIKQDIINNKAKITDIYFHMYISTSNSLSHIFDLSKQSVSHIYKYYLPYFLAFLPYSSKEIDWYKEQIENLLDAPTTLVAPDNIHITGFEKISNKSRPARKFVINGVEYPTLRAVGEEFSISPSTLWSRLNAGMTIEEAVSMPIKKVGKAALKV